VPWWYVMIWGNMKCQYEEKGYVAHCLRSKKKKIVASDNLYKNKLLIALLPTLFTFFKPRSRTIFQA
jgi:hypothetical protein